MTDTRYDGAYLAPAARLRGHGGARRGLDRVVSIREAASRRWSNGHLLAFGDAAHATFARDLCEMEYAGASSFPF